MDKLNQYRQIIQKILTDFQQWASGENQPEIQQCLAFDENRDQYFWFHVGWDGKHREFGVTVYLRIAQGKIWIEKDWTKQGIANQLFEAGVPPEDIVLGFQHPSKRSLTEFATA